MTVPTGGHWSGSRGRCRASTKPSGGWPRSMSRPMLPGFGMRATRPVTCSPTGNLARAASSSSGCVMRWSLLGRCSILPVGGGVVRGLVPLDVAAAGPSRGDGDAGLDGDLAGAGPDGDLDGLAGVGEPNLDLLPADHDGPADRDPPGDDQRAGQSGRLGGPGA